MTSQSLSRQGSDHSHAFFFGEQTKLWFWHVGIVRNGSLTSLPGEQNSGCLEIRVLSRKWDSRSLQECRLVFVVLLSSFIHDSMIPSAVHSMVMLQWSSLFWIAEIARSKHLGSFIHELRRVQTCCLKSFLPGMPLTAMCYALVATSRRV